MIILCVVLCLTGCNSLTSRSNITSLLSAPKLNVNESNIVAAIENYLGEDINLKYSKNQGYSAPIQLIDLNNDGISEAAVFYYAPNKGTNIRFAILSYNEDKWNIVMDKEGLGAEVFYFDTMVLPYVEGKQIAVGYLSSNIDENFFVTYFTDANLALEDYVESCQDIVTGDITGNGYPDIILTKHPSGKNISLNLLSFTEGLKFETLGSKKLKYNNIDITQIKINQTISGQMAVYVDYADIHSHMYTEIYALENGRFTSCVEAGVVSKNWEYEPVIVSTDINGDGYLETPTVMQPHYIEEVPTFKYLEWSDWTQSEVVRVYFGIYDVRENIFVALPDEWQNNIYAEAFENGFEMKDVETQQTRLTVTEIESAAQVESGAYSYVVYLGTKMWHINFSQDMSMSQVEYVYRSIKDFN